MRKRQGAEGEGQACPERSRREAGGRRKRKNLDFPTPNTQSPIPIPQ